MMPEYREKEAQASSGGNRHASRSGVQEELRSAILSLTEEELRLVIRLLAASQI